jgi:hypothetical protein
MNLIGRNQKGSTAMSHALIAVICVDI